MVKFMRDDLPDSCQADQPAWTKLRKAISIQQAIPLPASDSPAAKRMRVVAGVVVLAKALAKHVFLPTYLTQGDELNSVLSSLEDQDPMQEVFLRAALLKALPQRQNENRDAALNLVVAEVMDGLGLLILSARRAEFEASLRRISSEICHGWLQVQRLQDKVRLTLSIGFSEEWQPIPLRLTQASARPETPSVSSPSAQPSKAQSKDGRQALQQPKPEPKSPSSHDFLEAVWPAFLVANADQPQDGDDSTAWMLLHNGYAITKAQIKEAEDEMAAEESSSRRNRRTARQSIGDPRTTDRKRRDSAVFFSLPQGKDLG